MLHNQEAVVAFLQNGHELEEAVGPAHIQIGYVAVQLAEDAGVVAANEEDLIALQFRWLLMAPAITSTGATSWLLVSGRRETAGCSSISMMENRVLRGYQDEARWRCESEV